MEARNLFLQLLFIGAGYATVQLKASRHVDVPYALCTNNGTPGEECSTRGVFAMDRCFSASLQVDVPEGILRVVSDGETMYATDSGGAQRIMRYVNRIFCDEPVEPIIVRKTTSQGGSDVWIKLGPRWVPSAWNYSYEEEHSSKAARLDTRCLRLEQISVNVPEGYDINKYDHAAITALGWAISFGDLETVQIMVANGANLTHVALAVNFTAVHMSAGTCNDEILKFFIAKGETVAAVNERGTTPLHVGCHLGLVKPVRVLLNTYKGNVNAKDYLGRTALHKATKADNPELIDLLLTSGANIMGKDKNGFTALHFAVDFSDGKLVEKLVRAGIPVDEPNNDGTTPLMIAIQNGRPDPMDALIRLNANMKAKDKHGKTALSIFRTLPEERKSVVEPVLKAHGIKITEA